MTAGGASFAPRRWSLPADATLARRRSAWMSTASTTEQRVVRNIAFSCGLLPGLRRFLPPYATDQLLCLPEPLTPAKGFSCRRHTSPLRLATWRSTSMTSMLWSQERFCSSKSGATSNCAGATSLWRVFAGIPRRQSSLSTSFMKFKTRDLIVPK